MNYEGIEFPTPVKQIDRFGAQNRGIAINVFGCEKDSVIAYRLSRKDSNRGKTIKQIDLMLLESGEISTIVA